MLPSVYSRSDSTSSVRSTVPVMLTCRSCSAQYKGGSRSGVDLEVSAFAGSRVDEEHEAPVVAGAQVECAAGRLSGGVDGGKDHRVSTCRPSLVRCVKPGAKRHERISGWIDRWPQHRLPGRRFRALHTPSLRDVAGDRCRRSRKSSQPCGHERSPHYTATSPLFVTVRADVGGGPRPVALRDRVDQQVA